MRTLIYLLLVGASLLLASTSWGQNTSGEVQSSTRDGDVVTLTLSMCTDCDDAVPGEEPPEVNLFTQAHGIPSAAVFFYQAVGTCTGNLDVRHYDTTDAAAVQKLVLGTITIGGSEELIVDGPYLRQFTDLDTTNIAGASCAGDDLDVSVRLIYNKRGF